MTSLSDISLFVQLNKSGLLYYLLYYPHYAYKPRSVLKGFGNLSKSRNLITCNVN